MRSCSMLVVMLMALTGCREAHEAKTHTEPLVAAAEVASGGAAEEPLLDDGIDEADTAWLDDLSIELPPVWHGEQPPLRIETRHFTHTPGGLRDHYVILRAQDDWLELQGLVLNRGNCPYSETNQVVNGVDWPQALKFGQRKQVRAKCDKVIEAQVQTQYGEWTFTFD